MAARDEILAAAERLLDADGIEGVTIRRVAEASNYGRSSVVHWFGDKTGLLDALHIRAAERYAHEVLDQPLAYRTGTEGAPIIAASYPPPQPGQRPPTITGRLEQFRSVHPGAWEILRFRRCPDFDETISPTLVDVLDRLARGGLSQHRGRAVDVFAHQILSLHEFHLELSAVEHERISVGSPTASYFGTVFGIGT